MLPEEFARDQDRLDRFEREARLLAQLNHANIATLHGLEEHDVDTDEEARGPLALVGDVSVAFLIGPAADQQLALASIDGRLQQRIPIRSDGGVTGLAASRDGTSLYYAADGVIHRVSSTGGDSTPVNRGDEVAVDPSTGDLVILRRGDDAQLVRVPAAGGSETSIAVAGDWRASGSGVSNLTGHSVSSDGRLVIRTISPASWFAPVGTLDGRGGRSCRS